MHTMILSAAALIASAAALGAQTPSQAQHPARSPAEDVVVVSYADLDLARPDQARILERRLSLAAHRVCDDAHLPISHYRLRHLCIRETLADAKGQVAATRAWRTAQAGALSAVVRRAS